MTIPNANEAFELEDHLETRLMINKKFEIMENGKPVTVIVLDHQIRELHSQSLIDGSVFICIYLPSSKEIQIKDVTITEWQNRAYFIAKVKGHPISKQIFPFDDSYLKRYYKINVMPTGNPRWNYDDFESYLKEKEPNDPKQLFELQKQNCKKYLGFEEESIYDLIVLWGIGTYFHRLFDAYPYLDFTGTKRAGKTKALEYLKLVAFNSMMSPDFTGSSVFRLVELTSGTILLDESEQFRNQKSDNAQHVRTLLLQGFLKDQHAYRISKDTFQPESFNLYSPKALAHINSFDDVLEDRCIQIIMKRSTNKTIQDSNPNESDFDFAKIRNLSYRFFLDYANEIDSLRIDAQKIIPLAGREKLLWTPIITLALFFENHGIKGLTDSIIKIAKRSSKDRQLVDEQENLDYRIVSYLETQVTEHGWKTVSDLYKGLVEREEEYQIKADWFTRHKFTDALRRLGLKTMRKPEGICWLISQEEIDQIKARLEIGSEKATESAETTQTTSSGTNSTLDNVVYVENEANVAKLNLDDNKSIGTSHVENEENVESKKHETTRATEST